MEEEFKEAQVEMIALMKSTRSAILGTVDSRGNPLSSYAPVWIDGENRFHVYISTMAKHTSAVRRSGKASLMLIEDESASDNLFARKRLSVDCSSEVIERDTEEWNEIMSAMEDRLGETLGYLRNLVDFDLFRLTPSEGRLILGFGKAYRVFGAGLTEIGFIGGGGHKEAKN